MAVQNILHAHEVRLKKINLKDYCQCKIIVVCPYFYTKSVSDGSQYKDFKNKALFFSLFL